MSVSLVTRFRQFATDAASDELAGALLVNEVLDPGIDAATVRARLDDLADGCPDQTLPWAYLGEQGFAGNRDNYIDPANSCIADVLKTRQGIPGINFPGHFLARIDGVLVDPFVFQSVTEEDCLKRVQGGRTQRTFEVATNSMIALRMLNNVEYQFMGMARWHRVVDLIDCQLALTPGAVQLRFERGRAWEELGAPDVAERAYRELLQAPGSEGIREAVETRLKQLQQGSALWN